MTLSEWADSYAYLSAESSAEGGRWHTLPYQKGIMEQAMVEGLDENGQEVSEPAILFIDEVTACPARVVASQTVLVTPDLLVQLI